VIRPHTIGVVLAVRRGGACDRRCLAGSQRDRDVLTGDIPGGWPPGPARTGKPGNDKDQPGARTGPRPSLQGVASSPDDELTRRPYSWQQIRPSPSEPGDGQGTAARVGLTFVAEPEVCGKASDQSTCAAFAALVEQQRHLRRVLCMAGLKAARPASGSRSLPARKALTPGPAQQAG